MTERELNRAVANATGESIDRVQRIGFSLIVVPKRLPSSPYRRRQSKRSGRSRPE